MEDLKLLSLSDLFDLLVYQTNKHAHLRPSGATPQQMMASREFLRNLQAEIKLRKAAEKAEQRIQSLQSEPSFENVTAQL